MTTENHLRHHAAHAKVALDAFVLVGIEDDEDSVVVDLLCDLRHYVDVYLPGLDFDDLLERASEHYWYEINPANAEELAE